MALMTYLQRKKTGVYRLRRVVPDDLREAIGKREITVSLGTKDAAEAKRKIKAAAIEVDEYFDSVRRGDTLSDSNIRELVSQWWEVQTIVWYDSPEPRILEALDESLADFIKDIGREIRGADYENLRRAIADSIDRKRTALTTPSKPEPEQTPLIDQIEGTKPEPKPDGKVQNLDWLFEKYTTERRLPSKTLSEWTMVVKRFNEVVGSIPVKQIQKSHVRDFKDAMLQMPAVLTAKQRKMTVAQIIEATNGDESIRRLADNSVQKHLTAVTAIFSYAVANDYLAVNPAIGVRLAKREQRSQRRPFVDAELKAIFSSDLFRDKEVNRWLPRLGLYTGARLDELGQLRPEDVRQEHGVWVFDLNTLGGRKLKSEASKRKVPIHSVLIQAGFLKYVESREGKEWLFELNPDSHGVRTGNWSKWFGRQLDKLDIKERGKDFHSFRHTFKDACRNSGVPEPIYDAIQGHANGSVSRSYGIGYGLKALKESIEKVKFKSSRCYW